MLGAKLDEIALSWRRIVAKWDGIAVIRDGLAVSWVCDFRQSSWLRSHLRYAFRRYAGQRRTGTNLLNEIRFHRTQLTLRPSQGTFKGLVRRGDILPAVARSQDRSAMQGCRETGVGGPAASGARCTPMGKGATGGLEARDFPPLMPVQVRPRAPFPLASSIDPSWRSPESSVFESFLRSFLVDEPPVLAPDWLEAPPLAAVETICERGFLRREMSL